MSNFAETIKQELKNAGKTQRDLADFLGSTESKVSRIINAPNPSKENMIKIAQFLGVAVSVLSATTPPQIKPDTKDTEAELHALREVIKSKDEIIKAKDEIIAILKEKSK